MDTTLLVAHLETRLFCFHATAGRSLFHSFGIVRLRCSGDSLLIEREGFLGEQSSSGRNLPWCLVNAREMKKNYVVIDL